jgi:hypothetical protein
VLGLTNPIHSPILSFGNAHDPFDGTTYYRNGQPDGTISCFNVCEQTTATFQIRANTDYVLRMLLNAGASAATLCPDTGCGIKAEVSALNSLRLALNRAVMNGLPAGAVLTIVELGVANNLVTGGGGTGAGGGGTGGGAVPEPGAWTLSAAVAAWMLRRRQP